MSAEAVRAYYHRILPFFDLELAGRGDADFWAGEAAKPAGCRVLELRAGTGRATASLARAAGLRVSRLWGDYDRRPWDCATSPRLIAEMRLL